MKSEKQEHYFSQNQTSRPGFGLGEVASFRNYLMKYMEKTFIDTMPEWSPEELFFNAIAWKEGYRLFGCSRNLSKVMSRKTEKNLAFTCLSTSLHWADLGSEEDKIVWKNPTIINN